MLSLKYITENTELVKEGIEHKKCDVNISDVLSLDKSRKSIINEVEKLKANRNGYL